MYVLKVPEILPLVLFKLITTLFEIPLKVIDVELGKLTSGIKYESGKYCPRKVPLVDKLMIDGLIVILSIVNTCPAILFIIPVPYWSVIPVPLEFKLSPNVPLPFIPLIVTE